MKEMTDENKKILKEFRENISYAVYMAKMYEMLGEEENDPFIDYSNGAAKVLSVLLKSFAEDIHWDYPLKDEVLFMYRTGPVAFAASMNVELDGVTCKLRELREVISDMLNKDIETPFDKTDLILWEKIELMVDEFRKIVVYGYAQTHNLEEIECENERPSFKIPVKLSQYKS